MENHIDTDTDRHAHGQDINDRTKRSRSDMESMHKQDKAHTRGASKMREKNLQKGNLLQNFTFFPIQCTGDREIY